MGVVKTRIGLFTLLQLLKAKLILKVNQVLRLKLLYEQGLEFSRAVTYSTAIKVTRAHVIMSKVNVWTTKD